MSNTNAELLESNKTVVLGYTDPSKRVPQTLVLEPKKRTRVPADVWGALLAQRDSHERCPIECLMNAGIVRRLHGAGVESVRPMEEARIPLAQTLAEEEASRIEDESREKAAELAGIKLPPKPRRGS